MGQAGVELPDSRPGDCAHVLPILVNEPRVESRTISLRAKAVYNPVVSFSIRRLGPEWGMSRRVTFMRALELILILLAATAARDLLRAVGIQAIYPIILLR